MPHLSLSDTVQELRNRDELIFELIKERTVMHFGCIDDDAETIERKTVAGVWLHTNVTRHSRKTTGIDLNKAMIPELAAMGVNNICYGDIQDTATFTCPAAAFQETDTLLIPDVIEHLNNPGQMLQGIRDAFNKDVRIIITTPNPYMIMNFYDTLRRREGYSKWHTCYFSIANMKILLGRYGITIREIYPYLRASNSKSRVKAAVSGMLKRSACSISKGFADGFLYVCEIE
ncbi:hypothetical protein BAC3_01479 [uncultured bacterium]|nr:hypothetical protein BAC3_01479 [uncultured bacterium]